MSDPLAGNTHFALVFFSGDPAGEHDDPELRGCPHDGPPRQITRQQAVTQGTGTYEESDVPKWKLDRFRDWLRKGTYDA